MGVLTTIQLLSADRLKKNTSIDINVDDNLLTSNILLAQRMDLQYLLGTSLYTEIITAVSASTVTTIQTTLLQEYVLPYLEQRAYYHVLPFIWSKTKNSGVVNGGGENATSLEHKSLMYIRDITNATSEFMGERIKEFLRLNISSFPNYHASTPTDLLPSRSYPTGVYLENNNDDCNWGLDYPH